MRSDCVIVSIISICTRTTCLRVRVLLQAAFALMTLIISMRISSIFDEALRYALLIRSQHVSCFHTNMRTIPACVCWWAGEIIGSDNDSTRDDRDRYSDVFVCSIWTWAKGSSAWYSIISYVSGPPSIHPSIASCFFYLCLLSFVVCAVRTRDGLSTSAHTHHAREMRACFSPSFFSSLFSPTNSYKNPFENLWLDARIRTNKNTKVFKTRQLTCQSHSYRNHAESLNAEDVKL